jgi:hypothetical protein
MNASARRAARLVLLLSAFVALALLVSACGKDDVGSSSSRSTGDKPTRSLPPGSDVKAKLQVRLDGIGSKADPTAPTTYASYAACTKSLPASCSTTLTCPAKADAPAREHALQRCLWLGSGEQALASLTAEAPKRETCTAIYGGPQTAHVTGTLEGAPIDSTFTRTNGCEIARWDASARLWTAMTPEETGAGGPTAPSTPPTATTPTATVITDPPAAFER